MTIYFCWRLLLSLRTLDKQPNTCTRNTAGSMKLIRSFSNNLRTHRILPTHRSGYVSLSDCSVRVQNSNHVHRVLCLWKLVGKSRETRWNAMSGQCKIRHNRQSIRVLAFSQLSTGLTRKEVACNACGK